MNRDFPNVMIEGCSGGGGRFDAGMLYYYPQYWTSDNTDAIERLYIQYGTSMVMPSSTMGAHISAVPNHQVGRSTSLKTRGDVAMAGQLGYELDLNKLSDEEIEIVREQIIQFKAIRKVVHQGEMYRLKSPFEGRNTAWEFVMDDTVVLMYCTIMARCELGRTNVKLCGLELCGDYVEEKTGKVYSGSYLMNVGLYFDDKNDFESKLLIFKKLNAN
jgi:alpha-galactosidase